MQDERQGEYKRGCRLLRLVANQFVDDQAEKLIGFTVLIQPAEMFAAIAAACDLPDIVFEPGELIGGGAADITAGCEPEAADMKLVAGRIDEAVLMPAAYNEFFMARGDGGMAEMAEN